MTLCGFDQGSELLVISSLCLVHPQLTIWSRKWGVTSTLNLSSPVTLVQHRSWWSRRASKDLQLKLIFILLKLGPNYLLPKTNIEIPSLSATSSPGESPKNNSQPSHAESMKQTTARSRCRAVSERCHPLWWAPYHPNAHPEEIRASCRLAPCGVAAYV